MDDTGQNITPVIEQKPETATKHSQTTSRRKQKELENRIEVLERNLDMAGATINVTHENLMTLAEIVQRLSARVDSFHGPEVRNCRSCGRKINPGEKKCGLCGKPN